ncbi:hypothetical protein [Williamsia maris]|uniref:Uncharacterized protein n=1 Tax=Williamsia maris TaxID=72806 RepID=A0ABT1HIS9_9NOCA|nr:hypothetical protein [Williamsia maris]MCP2177838.1 hypothetical protein [Williamsia maris]
MRIVVTVALCIGVFIATGSTASGAPYPPVLPTGQVPAVATVPAPVLGGPGAPAVRYGAEAPVIAPGSYPVQARTGAGPVLAPPSETATRAVVVGLLLISLLSSFYAVRRIRLRR